MHYPTNRIAHFTTFDTPLVEHWLKREIAQWFHHEGSTRANALTQRCQPGTTHICKIMTKNPYNLPKKTLQIVNTIAKHNFGIGSRCNTPIYNNKQNTTCCVTDHLLSCSRSIAGVTHCKLTTVRI